MIKDSLTAAARAARTLFHGRGALALFNLLYAALLLAVYFFFSTKEATALQLATTALLALAAPLLFFVLQAAAVNYARGEPFGFAALLGRALRDFWKILLVSLPLIALGVLVAYLINKLQGRFPLPDAPAPRLSPPYARATPHAPVYWQHFVFPALRLLLLGVALPLLCLQLWIALAHEGFKATFKKLHRVVGRAFAPRAIFIYTAGLVAFALIPYFLLFTRTQISSAWGELAVFGLRLALAFVFTLWGWLITVGALTNVFAEPRAEAPPTPEPVVNAEAEAPTGASLPSAEAEAR